MAIEPMDGDRALMDQYALPWIEANEDRSSDANRHLHLYRESLEKDGVKATKAVERLISSGRGQALKALEAHWARVRACFDRTTGAALDIASEILGCGDTIAIGKGRAKDIVSYLREMNPDVGTATPDAKLQRHIDVAREDLEANVTTTLTEAREGASRARAAENVVAVETVPATLSGLLGRGIGGGVGDGVRGSSGDDLPDGIRGSSGNDLPDGIRGSSGNDLPDGIGSGTGGSPFGSPFGPAPGPVGGTNAGSWNVFVDHDEHKRAADGLIKVAETIRGDTTTALARALYDLDALAASGSVGSTIAAEYTPLLNDLDLAGRALADHLSGPLRDIVLTISTDQQDTDDDNRGRFDWWRD
ncbi:MULTISPECIES: hypothetical protein [Streptomyces]|uniref:Uncharacterized protein n=1 Tax=Streptomyces viridochromogenes TaxID=1938 RepID=A0A0L8KTX4_STRVR|nr:MULTISPECIES: hypothetical protein [Streptomyces]KOG29179.1 hypothetical protein ADK34_13120 [Streptomyces viridochromogenes]